METVLFLEHVEWVWTLQDCSLPLSNSSVGPRRLQAYWKSGLVVSLSGKGGSVSVVEMMANEELSSLPLAVFCALIFILVTSHPYSVSHFASFLFISTFKRTYIG
jgi:hypothetical protein